MDLSKSSFKQANQTRSLEPTPGFGTSTTSNGKMHADSNAIAQGVADVTSNGTSNDGFIWKNGIGTLAGCDNLQFRKNASGDLELITQNIPGVEAMDQDLPATVIPDVEKQNEASNQRSTNNMTATDVTAESNQKGVQKTEACDSATTPMEHHNSKAALKNGNLRRNVPVRVKKDTSRFNGRQAEAQPENPEDSNSRSRDLKIRIRLPSPPSVDAGPENSRKRKSTIDCSPMGDRKDGKFSWSDCELAGGNLAPASAFEILTGKNPFPGENHFKLGMALEGVDPVHQSLICPLSVTAVKGFRIRLHFCGYMESYDFWTNADSPMIFPCGFCEKTGRKLEPPKGLQSENFNWEKYMKKFKLYAAPDVIFSVISEEKDCTFKPEEKLEAVDKHNPDLICAATVADVIGENILIHFDGWTHDFDYWCTSSSRLIHPVGWCQKVGKILTPPEGYPHDNFSWNVYLSECGAAAASEGSFTTTSRPHGLKQGMKMEAVDIRNPILIRVATIVSINDYRMKIHFDGWSKIYDFTIDLESPDIHPPGWCSKAGYALQPPVTEDNRTGRSQSGCPVRGCIGVGHIRGSKFAGHHSEFGCPYSQQNFQKFKNYLLDRLSKSRSSTSTQEPSGYKSGSDAESNDNIRSSKLRRTRKSLLEAQRSSPANSYGKKSPTPPSVDAKKTVVSSSQLSDLFDEHGKSHYTPQDHSVFISALSSYPNYDLPLCWDQQSKILPNVRGLRVKEVSKWTISQVSSFVGDLTGRADYGRVLAAEEIDGEAFLLLTQVDIAKVLNIKLGPALKIYNAILLIKAADHLPI